MLNARLLLLVWYSTVVLGLLRCHSYRFDSPSQSIPLHSTMADIITTSIGFGTAALGSQCYAVVLLALAAGFRTFDTAEADWWYDQAAVGRALAAYAAATSSSSNTDDECYLTTTDTTSTGQEGEGETACMNNNDDDAANNNNNNQLCHDLRISTKIPPWELTSADHIRSQARASRDTLLGFCDTTTTPLDVYYIHAPRCWTGWHPKCTDDTPPALPLRESWRALEAVVGLDHSARRIGLSNVHPPELLDIIQFVQERQETQEHDGEEAPPRMPDAVQIFADPIQPAEEMRKICREHNIEFVSYRYDRCMCMMW